MTFINALLYWTLLASFFSFVGLYLYLERAGLKTSTGRGILMFFVVIAVSMAYGVLSYYFNFPAEQHIKVILYIAMNIVGWGASVMLVKANIRGRRRE